MCVLKALVEDGELALGDIDGESRWKVEEGDYMKVEMEKVSFALDHLGKGIFKF